MTIRTPTPSRRALALAALLAPLLASSPARAADGNPATSNLFSGGMTIPYEGYLMLDNTPMTGAHTVRFELWDDTSASAATNLRYAETQTITLFNGLFSAAIGAGTRVSNYSLIEAVLDGDRLYLAISIQDGTGSFVPLTGRQAIEAAPFSAWTGNASNLSVAGDLRVVGSIVAPASWITIGAANVSGALAAGGIQSASNITAAGTLSGSDVVVTSALRGSTVVVSGAAAAATLRTSGAATVQSLSVTSGSATLGNLTMANAPGGSGTRVDSSGAIALFPSGSDAAVHVAGNLRVTDNTHDASTCGWTSWVVKVTSHASSSPSSGATTYNPNQCPDGRFVAGMDFTHHTGDNQTFQEWYRLYCCEL